MNTEYGARAIKQTRQQIFITKLSSPQHDLGNYGGFGRRKNLNNEWKNQHLSYLIEIYRNYGTYQYTNYIIHVDIRVDKELIIRGV